MQKHLNTTEKSYSLKKWQLLSFALIAVMLFGAIPSFSLFAVNAPTETSLDLDEIALETDIFTEEWISDETFVDYNEDFAAPPLFVGSSGPQLAPIVPSGAPIANGVYVVQSKGTNAPNGNPRRMDVRSVGSQHLTGTNTIQQYGDSDPIAAQRRAQLFKFTYIGESSGIYYYDIRPMTNSGLTIEYSVSGTPQIKTADYGTNDAWSLPWSVSWGISGNTSNGYTLKAGNTSYYLAVPSSNVNEQPLTLSTSSTTANSKWSLIPYTGDIIRGVSASGWKNALALGQSFQLSAYMYSSVIGENGPPTFSVLSTDGGSTDIATVNASGLFTAGTTSIGVFRACWYTTNLGVYYYANVAITIPNGVYWFSNTNGITSGNPRVMDAEGPSYASMTEIQQWKSLSPASNLYYAQTWIVRHVGGGYYTIASSKKQDMYVSWYGTNGIKLEQCSADTVSTYNDIQWKIEGASASGYTVTNRLGDSYALTVPSSTSDGVALEWSNKTVSNGGRNRWNLNRIDGVYLLSIYSCSNTSSSGDSSNDSGHSYVVFENLSSTAAYFGKVTASIGERMSIGTWGNKSQHIGIWYNLEMLFGSNFSSYSQSFSLTVLINSSDLYLINAYINDHDSWGALGGLLPINNCSTFAQGLWYSFGGCSLPMSGINTPANLKSAIDDYDWYVAGFIATTPGYQGYYHSSSLFEIVNGISSHFVYVSSSSLLAGGSSSFVSPDFEEEFLEYVDFEGGRNE